MADTILETLVINKVTTPPSQGQPNQIYYTQDTGNAGQSQYSGAGIQSVTYDGETLGEHLTELLGFINNENGGSLLSFGFKVGANTISATAKNIQFNNDGTIAITDGTVTPFTQGDFVNCTLKHINDTKTGAYFNCGINQISNATLEITGTNAKLSNNQLTTNAGNGSPLMTYYESVDITNMELEHLTITYSL